MTANETVAAGAGQSATAPGGALRPWAAAGYRWLLLAFLVAGGVQIFLAGLGVFHLHAYGLDAAAGDSALDPHRMLGFIMGGMAIVILVLAFVARPGGRAIAGAAVLVVQTDFLQSLMAGLGDDSAVWGGLHALDGFLAIAVAAYLYGRALGLSRGNRGRAKS
jgi:divalent metal cation (Fe/Co/Zn/Cd) transporter